MASFVLCILVMSHYLFVTLKSIGKNVLFIGTVFLLSQSWAATGDVQVNHMNEVTHIEIEGLGSSDYQINKNQKTVTLKVNNLDDKKLAILKGYTDKHIKRIDIQKTPALDQDVITLQLVSNKVEMFDYLTDAPSSLSIDFYFDDEQLTDKTVSVENNEKSKNKKNAEGKDKNNKESSVERKLASSEFIKTIDNVSLLSDIEGINENSNESVSVKNKTGKKPNKNYSVKNTLDFDVDKIKFPLDILIEAQDKVFLNFPILLNESEYLESIVKKAVSYEVPEAKDQETKDFIKAKKMFDKKEYKFFFKAKKIFNKKYSKSKYAEMISYMTADALLEIYKIEKDEEVLSEALTLYDSLVAKYPNSNLRERTHLLLSYLRMKEKKYLDAARSLKSYQEIYNTSPLVENIKRILAQALMRSKQYRDAGKIYEELLSSPTKETKQAATFDIGDTFLEKKDYSNAIRYYKLALAAYPKESKKYPNVHFNLAQALFLTAEYKESLIHYRYFIQDHPLHSYSSYAWTRIGEILEIAKKEENEWRGFYNESIFRFNNEEGARVARIHLICNDAIKTSEDKLPLYLKELELLSKEVAINYIQDFIAFKLSDVYFNRGKYELAADHLIAFFKDSKVPVEVEKFHKRIGRALAGLLREEIHSGTADTAIAALNKYDALWLNKSKIKEFNYLKARVYQKAETYSLAEKYFKDYLKSIDGFDFNKTSEKLPRSSAAYIYLSKVQMSMNKVPNALENLDKINLDEVSSSDQMEFFRLKRDIAVGRSDWEDAESNALKIKNYNKQDFLDLANIYEKNSNYAQAVNTIDKYVNEFKPTENEKFKVLKLKVNYLSKANSKDKYKSFLARFYDEFKDSKNNFDKEKYELGKIYIEEESQKDAQDVLSKISENSIWAKLASEQLEQKNWNKKYKKYIDRVPAMNKSEEGK